jgi:hypothetical protein
MGTLKVSRRYIGVSRPGSRASADPARPSVRHTWAPSATAGRPARGMANSYAVCRQVPAAWPDGPHDASRDRGCPPGSARAAVPHASAGQLARQHNGDIPRTSALVGSPVRRHVGHQRTPSRPPSSRGPARMTGRPHMEGTPGSAAPLKPGHAASAARPWPSVESPTVSPTVVTVRTDRRNCGYRPSLQH